MNTAGHTDAAGLDLIPFRGVRYVPEQVGSLAAVTSPPYDVIVRPDGLLHLESADPHNIVRLILPQATSPAARNQQAADTLRSWLREGILAPDAEPSLYVYEQRDSEILQRGIIGALRLSEAAEGIVLPHEDVMPHVVEDRAALMRATSANLEPLLLTYRSDSGDASEGDGGSDGEAPGARGIIERTAERAPLLSTITEDGFQHRLWSVTDPAEIAQIQSGLAAHQALIADGHHRWATNLRLRAEHPSPSAWDYGLVLLVDTARYPLRVRAIHRYLHRLPVSEALAALGDSFRIRTVEGPLGHALDALAEAAAKSNAFVLAGDGAFHLVDRPSPDLLARTIPGDHPEAWRTLDATVLHATLLDHVWRIPDTPDHIAYIHDTAATVEKAERDGGTAILMHPVREEVVRDLARQGVTMPRKSTSFGPKPATGLVLRALAF
ncbi:MULTISPECIES: DUF1015 domain-containing protein [Streptomyces]|uniref:DUF1015 domain-containing protein n=1 Tax=Streptomyces TaxID=1883 RepID=UPI001E5BD41A|nr:MULTISPECIES: DUF1015 domain-containing protein [Streptomyces]UFQ14823.1 DUF1015 domain-containing protein [Streptomyces huasconensis]WCL84426.1 DUF1015 domain-containing protein [Streptomyces sp. JCM 35825]